jgi:hypothetical protein
MRSVRLLIASFAVCACACGLFPDLSTLSADAGDAGDASNDSTVDAARDTGSDAGGDASADARPSPCTATHLFCDDFDQGALGAKWDSVHMTSGPLVLSTTNVVTPPNALEATASTSSDTESMLTKHFPSANHTHVELDAFVVNPSDTSNTEIDFVSFDISTPPSPYTYANLNLQRWQAAALLEQYAQTPDAGNASVDMPVAQTFNTWTHVTLDIDFGAQTYALALDGVPVTQVAFAPQLPQSAFDFSVGVAYTSGSSAEWNIFIDNVVVDQQ